MKILSVDGSEPWVIPNRMVLESTHGEENAFLPTVPAVLFLIFLTMTLTANCGSSSLYSAASSIISSSSLSCFVSCFQFLTQRTNYQFHSHEKCSFNEALPQSDILTFKTVAITCGFQDKGAQEKLCPMFNHSRHGQVRKSGMRVLCDIMCMERVLYNQILDQQTPEHASIMI